MRHKIIIGGNIAYVKKLYPGDIVKEGDLYLSTTGQWQPVPMWDFEIKNQDVEFARLV